MYICLEQEQEQRLHDIGARAGRSSDEIARDAIIEMIEDKEDCTAAQAILENPGRRWTLEDIEAALDLKAE